MWQAVRSWLAQVPVTDPVDRRNAPVIQLLLIFIGCAVPLNTAYYVFIVGMRHRPGWIVDLSTDLVIALMAWTSFALVRRDRFRPAIVLFLATVLASAGAVYATAGFQVSLTDKIPMLLLALGGLILGRRSLWTIFGLLMTIFGLGMLNDVARAWQAGRAFGPVLSNGPPMVLSYIIIAIVLDRTIAALRESLAESNERGRRLQDEMAARAAVRDQLIHAQKLEVVGRVASGVAHDFDNVLNVVLGYAMRRERLADQGSEALLEAMEGVELAARRALSISRKLLNFSRQDVSHPEVFDAAASVRALQPMLRQLFSADVRLTATVEERALPIYMDRGQFELVLLNLASNARDAMPAGGSFLLDARCSRDGGYLQLILADTGVGMSEEVAARVFEPFYTTKPMGSGTGIGLAVVHDLIDRAGGSIAVESAQGAGTTFRLGLPLKRVGTGIGKAAFGDMWALS